MTSFNKIAKRVAFRFLKKGSSQLPSQPDGASGRTPEVYGFSTLREEGEAGGGLPRKPHPNDKEFEDGSIHDVEFADDLPKIQTRRRDEIDHSDKKFRINQPSVPDDVRR